MGNNVFYRRPDFSPGQEGHFWLCCPPLYTVTWAGCHGSVLPETRDGENATWESLSLSLSRSHALSSFLALLQRAFNSHSINIVLSNGSSDKITNMLILLTCTVQFEHALYIPLYIIYIESWKKKHATLPLRDVLLPLIGHLQSCF